MDRLYSKLNQMKIFTNCVKEKVLLQIWIRQSVDYFCGSSYYIIHETNDCLEVLTHLRRVDLLDLRKKSKILLDSKIYDIKWTKIDIIREGEPERFTPRVKSHQRFR